MCLNCFARCVAIDDEKFLLACSDLFVHAYAETINIKEREKMRDDENSAFHCSYVLASIFSMHRLFHIVRYFNEAGKRLTILTDGMSFVYVKHTGKYTS